MPVVSDAPKIKKPMPVASEGPKNKKKPVPVTSEALKKEKLQTSLKPMNLIRPAP